MDGPSFRALVRRLERLAADQPRVYRLRLAGLALLGYGYVLVVLAGLIGFTAILLFNGQVIVFQLAIPLLLVILAMLRALWISAPPPQGLVLGEREVPALFALARRMGRRLQAPRVHVVLAIPDLNAAVMQVPRLGVFGWYRNYLLIGLPLLQALSAGEWEAVLAHEMGHLSKRHGRFGAWIYRVRATWGRLLATLGARRSRIGQLLFRRFINWYAPYFNAYSFVLARAHEYEADRAAAEAVGAKTAGEALIRIAIATRRASEFWTDFSRRAVDSPQPPPDPIGQLRLALRDAGAEPKAATQLSEVWTRTATSHDTHPTLADRLRALGWSSPDAASPAPPEPLREPSAAAVYLGAAESRIEHELDRTWVGRMGDVWKQRHAELTEARTRLAELDGRPAGSLSADEEMERIAACGALGDLERVGTLAEDLLQRVPDHPGALFHAGQRLLNRGDPGGVQHVERAMHQDPDAILPGCRLLFEFYRSRGDQENANRYLDMAGDRSTLLREAQAERGSVKSDVVLQPHEWSAEQVAALIAQLRQFPDVREAYLARRVVRILPEQPCYVLGVVPQFSRETVEDLKRGLELCRAIAQRVKGPWPVNVFLLQSGRRRLLGKFRAIPGTRLL